MRRQNSLAGTKHQDIGMQKYYILTRPTKLSDLTLDDIYDDSISDRNQWRKKSRDLQKRRWSRLEDRLA